MLSRPFPARVVCAVALGLGLLFLSFSSYRDRLPHEVPSRSSHWDSHSTLKAPLEATSTSTTVPIPACTTPIEIIHAIPTTSSTSSPSPSPSPTSPHPKSNDRCNTLKKSDDIVVILKTGANEVFEKLPTQILTMLQCVDNLLIFSDLEQQIGAYHIHDALKDIADEVKDGNPDFDYYRTLQEYHKTGQNIGTIRDETGESAWNLDKYKFLPMLEKTWEMRPNKKWYVYIEADTYLVWSNLLLYLDRLDPTELIYRGSPTYSNDEAFAHGGSGYILSGAAMTKVFGNRPGVAAKYDPKVKYESMGDYMLMKALREEGVELKGVWPILQGEKPASIPFGGGPDNGARHWCQPLLTMHHISASEISQVWRYELERTNPMEPFLMEELYHNLVQPSMVSERDDWYNLSDDQQYRAPGEDGERQKPFEEQSELEKMAFNSFEDCRAACQENAGCFQYAFHDNTCGFSFSWRLGHKNKPDDQGSYKSGWITERIEKEQAEYPCTEPKWE